MVTVCVLLSFFYVVVVAWSLWYMVASLQTPLPWSSCDHDFNTIHCVDGRNYGLNNYKEGGGGGFLIGNMTSSAEEEYWANYVLGSRGKTWQDFVRNSLMSYFFLSWYNAVKNS